MEIEPKKKFILFRLIDIICDLGGSVAAICLAMVTLIVVLEVFMRYVLNSPTSWVAETSIYLTMAVGLLAAAYSLKNDSHFSVNFFTDRLSVANRRRMKIVTNIVGAAYCSVFIFKGIEMAKFSYEMEDVSSGLLEIPLWIPNLLVPIGGLLLTLQFISKLAEVISKKNPQ